MKGFSLKSKILIGTVGIVIFLGLLMIILIQGTLPQRLLFELQRKGIFISRHLSDMIADHMSADHMWTKQTMHLQMMVNDFKNYDKDVEYIFIQDSDGKVLADTFKGGFSVELKDLNPIVPGKGYRIEALMTEKGEMFDISSPIMKGKIGVTHVGISKERLKRGVDEIITMIAGIIITVLIVGVGIAFVFARRVTMPLYELVEAAKGVSSGNLERKVCVRTKDEIGQLGFAFNKMIEGLQETTVSRNLLVKEIEERKRAGEELKAFAEKLEQSNQELEDFAYIVSHDLQEPLRKVTAFGERLKTKYSDNLGEQGKDYLERMQNATKRMQTLINDLLTFSRVTTRAQPFVPVDLSTVAKEVLSDLEVRIEQVKGRVEVGDLPVIDADPLQMRQLFQNLIGNALKFHRKEEPPVVKIQCQTVNPPSPPHPPLSKGGRRGGEGGMGGFSGGNTANNRYCQISVQDNGIGFYEKYTDRIFSVFQRLHSRSEYDGTGIGLAVCRKIVERHGGDITVRSTPGQGTTFIVTLPVKQSKGGNG